MVTLDRIFRPKTIAAVGGNWAERVVEQCLLGEFKGKIWPINPNRETMHGVPCLPSIKDVPEPPDCTFVGVNREQSISTLEHLAKVGGGGAVCFASGFAEIACEDDRGNKYQEDLVKAAGTMPFLGPNCYGLVNYLDGIAIWPDVHGGKRQDSGVAIICQSSNIAINITMQARGLPIGYVITTGNQANISMASIALGLLDDPRVTAIGMYIEGFGDIREFEHLTPLAKAKQIPLVVLKVGNSKQAASLTLSHTSSLAGSYAGSTALLKRLGIGQVTTIPEMIETLKILHLGGPLKGRKIASMSCSGGEACLIADLGHQLNLNYTKLDKNQIESLKCILGGKVHLANPLDYHTYLWGNEEELFKVFLAMMSGDYDMVYLVMDFPRSDRCQAQGWDETLQACIRAKNSTNSRVAIVSVLPENLSEKQCEYLYSNEIIPLCGMSEALKASEICADIAEFWNTPTPLPIALGPSKIKNISTAEEIVIRQQLSNFGVSFPMCYHYSDLLDLETNLAAFEYPVVLKKSGLIHKSENEGVVLNLNTKDSLLEVARRMNSPQGFLVEQQITNGIAEILIGVSNDFATGLMLTLASGGIYSELWNDAHHLLLPISKEEIESGLKELKIWPLLQGYRGQPRADIEYLVKTITAVANFAGQNHTTLVEFEINPFISLTQGGYAVDILARFTDEGD